MPGTVAEDVGIVDRCGNNSPDTGCCKSDKVTGSSIEPLTRNGDWKRDGS
jgi:hypothetical protein